MTQTADLHLPGPTTVPTRTVLRVLASIIADPDAVRTQRDESPGGTTYTETTYRIIVLGVPYTLKLILCSTRCNFYLYRMQETGMRWRIDGKVLRNAPFFVNGLVANLRDEDVTFSPAIAGHLVMADLALLIMALGK